MYYSFLIEKAKQQTSALYQSPLHLAVPVVTEYVLMLNLKLLNTVKDLNYRNCLSCCLCP